MDFPTHFNRTPSRGVHFEPNSSLVQSQFQRDCDINVMIQRALGGDMSVFAGRGNMLDASDSPDSLHEALNIQKVAENHWDSLPTEVKQSYGNIGAFLEAYDKYVTLHSASKSDNKSEQKSISAPSPDKGEASKAESVQPST